MDSKRKITGNHLIATLKDIEASCAAVRQALEQHPDPGSLLIDFDQAKAAVTNPPAASMGPGGSCEAVETFKVGPHLNAPGACGTPPEILPDREGPIERGARTTVPTAPPVRRGKGSERGN
jgi:hypothetical protein